MSVKEYELWINKSDPEYRKELEGIAGDSDKIEERFGSELEFGTAGLRGKLGAGTAYMNLHTVALATEAFARMLKEQNKENAVAIAFDSRNYSPEFAQRTAEVFAANGIKVYLYRQLMPTPALSFAVRELKCQAGVMITASHNPSEYNGYKAYGPDGGQLTPEAADIIAEKMRGIDCFSIKALPLLEGLDKGIIEWIAPEVTEKYLDAVEALSLSADRDAHKDLKVIYTPLNGAGLMCVTEILKRTGFSDVTVVEKQREPDGNFPTCPYPNPEMDEAMKLGFELLKETGGDVLIATDPDCDRIGVGARNSHGEYCLLNGNEIGGLLVDYICSRREELGTMPSEPVMVKSVVSSDLADRVAESYGVQIRTVLTGFKYIGEILTGLQQEGREGDFLLGFEESHGYLSGAHVRDKDAVNASMLLCELAARCKQQGKTIADHLEGLYEKHGYIFCKVSTFAFGGAHPMQDMKAVMEKLRANPLEEICGRKVTAYADFSAQTEQIDGKIQPTGLGKTNMLRYRLGKEGWAIVRPSGTEPKMKVYLNLQSGSREQAEELAGEMIDEIGKLLKN